MILPVARRGKKTSGMFMEREMLIACQKLDFERMEDFINAGVSPDYFEQADLSPLFLAVLHKQFDFFMLLLSKGVKFKEPLYINVMLNGDEYFLPYFSRIVERGFHLNYLMDSLMVEVIMGREEKALEMIAAGQTDLNRMDAAGQTVLFYAVMYGRLRLVEALIKAGANVNAVSFSLYTPLMLASAYKQTEILKILLAAGADLTARGRDRTSVYYWAADAQVKEILAKAGHPVVQGRTSASFVMTNYEMPEGE